MSHNEAAAVVLSDVLDVLWAVRGYLPDTTLGNHDRQALDAVYARGSALLEGARTHRPAPVKEAPDNAAMLARHGVPVEKDGIDPAAHASAQEGYARCAAILAELICTLDGEGSPEAVAEEEYAGVVKRVAALIQDRTEEKAGMTIALPGDWKQAFAQIESRLRRAEMHKTADMVAVLSRRPLPLPFDPDDRRFREAVEYIVQNHGNGYNRLTHEQAAGIAVDVASEITKRAARQG